MLVLVTYDIQMNELSGAKRLRRISKICKDYGQRVQYSIFECDVTPAQWETLKFKLLQEYESELDSFRFYFLGSNWKRRVEHHGAKPAIDMEAPLIL